MLDHSTTQGDCDPVPALLRQLETGNDVIRTGAVRAMAAQISGDDRVRQALLAALLDEDVDVRSDAMDGLVNNAVAKDAEIIRRSLMGDPVREVKHAAIACLVALNDAGSVPVLRRLALSRCADDVAWEDETDAWDDWLDIQIAAIDALGQMQVIEAIDDILAARDDEMGQTLDSVVFRALRAMGSEGAVWLLSVAQTETGLARKRAIKALAAMGSDLLLDQADYLLGDETAAVRVLALPLLRPGDGRREALALRDPDVGVRCAALARSPDLAEQCLADSSERVQALALDLLRHPMTPELQGEVGANALAWLTVAGADLASAAARILPRIAPDQAADALTALARDTARPLEARIEAVAVMATVRDAATCERLIALLGNETQQVRTVALTHLATAARGGDEAAIQALALAMDGILLAPDQAVVVHENGAGLDVRASKGDGEPRLPLRITPEGEIVVADTDAVEGQSTLGQIQQGLEAVDHPAEAEDTPEEAPNKRRKRRAVEGPDGVGDDLRHFAVSLAGDVPGEPVELAVLAASQTGDEVLRLAAYRALENRAELSDLGWARVEAGLDDPVAAIRSVAAQTVARNPDYKARLAGYLTDSDALVRAIAVEACAEGEAALTWLSDPVRTVRATALRKVLAGGDNLALAGFAALMQAERIDTLGDAIQTSELCRTAAFETLTKTDLPIRQVHVVLQALAARPVSGATGQGMA